MTVFWVSWTPRVIVVASRVAYVPGGTGGILGASVNGVGGPSSSSVWPSIACGVGEYVWEVQGS